MTAPVQIVIAFLALVASARTCVTVPLLGPTPVLALVAVAMVLALAAAVLVLVRAGRRDGWLRLRPVVVDL